ncbi:BING4CT-domain-containing protein [Viridothelium virens]|uniref:U three protein 7 n=1 Tax=Viridothelium virens TaxID=1048519 RepID=A0A6A6HFE0_VIRVR|nr:BING4CT-domain-containing protein [Viridothelium virens]
MEPGQTEVERQANPNITSAQPTSRKAHASTAKPAAETAGAKRRAAEAHKTYGRGRKIETRKIKDKKLRGSLRTLETKYKDATVKAKDAEILLENDAGFLQPEGELERTYKIRQNEIKENATRETAKKGFDLKLDQMGPYLFDYTRNGRDLLLGGRLGHIATMDWRSGKLGCELNLGESVRDVKWLHNNQSFAVAQKKYVYIYDRAGVEIHKLQNHIDVTHMEFLPYHFLLATIGNAGYLKYTDTSTGQTVIELPTKKGTPTAFAQNPYNAVCHVGHQNGTVSLWSPNSSTPLVKLLAHRGPVRALAMDREGRYMVSTGQDLRMSIWDIRNFKEVDNYGMRQPGSSIAISDRGLTSVSWGTSVTIWKDVFNKSNDDQQRVHLPYMNWGGEGNTICRARWCPLEDVLGISHDKGFSSILVPGAGEPNFDALEVNPFETVKQRQEAEVKGLLNKLQPEMISLDPNFIGNVDLAPADQRRRELEATQTPAEIVARLKKKGKGKNSALKRYLRKKSGKNIIDAKRLRIEALVEQQRKKADLNRQQQEDDFGPALARFARKNV